MSVLKLWLSDKPTLFFAIARLLATRDESSLVKNNCEIIIEGFPRSANTFTNSTHNVNAVFDQIDEINQKFESGNLTYLARPIPDRGNATMFVDQNESCTQAAVALYGKIKAECTVI